MRFQLLLLCVCLSFTACQKAEVNEQVTVDGHQQMVELLQEVAKEAEVNNEYFQSSDIKKLTNRLTFAPKNGMLQEKFLINWQLGPLYLNLGENQKAVEHLETVFQMAPKVKESLDPEQINTLLFDLSLAHLRVGEAQNCVHCQTGESCIFPIQGGGIHGKEKGSREAIKYLNYLLDNDPDNLTAIWLLNIAHMTLGEHDQLKNSPYYIPDEAFAKGKDYPEFKEVAKSKGIAEMSCAGGSSAEDFDNDGDLDLIVSNWDVRGQLKVFLNKGDGTFEDHTENSGVQGILGGLNIVHADYDNDGDVDIFVLRGAWMGKLGKYPNSLLQNDGSANFRDVTFEAGLGIDHYPTQTAAFADYDNDGDLDLFIGNENEPSQLFQNDGNGHFIDVADKAGVSDCGYAKGAVWGDYDNDRWPDLYVSNVEGPNRLFRNLGDGSFKDVAPSLSVTEPIQSFPAWFWDYNNDGNLDLYVSSYKVGAHYVAAEYLGHSIKDAHFPSLYSSNGKGGFTDVCKEIGLDTVTQPMGANFGDLDNDGYLDFYLGTGYIDFQGLMPNRLFHNEQGLKFADVTTSARVGHLQKGHGVSFADFDQDGDQDIFIETGGAFRGDAFRNNLFENPGFDNNYIKLKLEGKESNRSAIGAKIRVDFTDQGESRSVYRWVGTGGSFGANPLQQNIGIGKANIVDSIEIYWPTSDTTQTFKEVKINSSYQSIEGSSSIINVTDG